jgi:hypothetical protein
MTLAEAQEFFGNHVGCPDLWQRIRRCTTVKDVMAAVEHHNNHHGGMSSALSKFAALSDKAGAAQRADCPKCVAAYNAGIQTGCFQPTGCGCRLDTEVLS